MSEPQSTPPDLKKTVDDLKKKHEETIRKTFMDKIQALYKNVEAMEVRLKKKNKDPLQDKHYRRAAGALAQSVTYARKQGWMRAPAASSN